MLFIKQYFISFIILLFTNIVGYTQNGIISGVLEYEDGPLPGANIIVKGTSNGVTTDFDGKYSIECKVGDTLQFISIGMTPKEIKVTTEMFGNQKLTPFHQTKPVHKIISNDYLQALKTVIDSLSTTPEISKNGVSYNSDNGYLDIDRIKYIKEDHQKIKITYFNPDIYYRIRFNSSVGLQFVDRQKTPKTQNTYAQGRPFNGTNQWFGADNNELFSYGPTINSLTFDGSNYSYDTNGRLINGVSRDRTLPYNNQLFEPSLILSNTLNLAAFNSKHSIDLDAKRKTQEDIFQTTKNNTTKLGITYKFKKKITAFFTSNFKTNNQPNTNGFLTNVLLASYVTPVTFQNNQGYITNNTAQRSFSPTRFNNPFWLLHLNQNKNSSTSTTIGAKSKFKTDKHLNIHSFLSFNKQKNKLNFALPIHTVGFENGYVSRKYFSEYTLHTDIGVNYQFWSDNFSLIKVNSSLKNKNTSLNYSLSEYGNFSDLSFNRAIDNTLNDHHLRNNTLRMLNEITFDFDVGFDADLTLRNNSVTSSLQGNQFFLPSILAYMNISQLLRHSDWLDRLSIAIGVSKEAKGIPLYYNNLSHNSLTITPLESQSLLANNDLFNSKELEFEKSTTFDIENAIGLFNNRIEIGLNYYYSKTKGSIFPILTNGTFKLQNSATIKNEGIEGSLEFRLNDEWRNFQYQPTFLFSKNRSKVIELSDNKTSIPIAGFKTISKNLIVGEQTGAIVGSAFLRDPNGSIVIDDDGYPMVDPEQKIIGNTTPDFNISINNSFRFGKLKCNFLIDYQQGGDVWNGTKNVLNYMGRSQESAHLRNTRNFIFTGVNQSGTPNTKRVDFANTSQDVSLNRWVRYGYTGVDEEAIVDGTFINLKSISISYDTKGKNTFFRQLELSLYANNLFSYTKEKGISPYSSLFDYSAGKGLDYFNTPLIKEIGFKVNIKI
ncbi:carboxypeptidase-like regulatory domain-containing protein [Aquimarina longa]|uniref:carboxypeptidase-like regulatory domain-containing protein n=1 Tax=Aquimarina longa TaxID=1080221 RepID=UPI0007821010|nr:carboxypeptidase-like regulatory domain-containing protein [Aquimarina longa]